MDRSERFPPALPICRCGYFPNHPRVCCGHGRGRSPGTGRDGSDAGGTTPAEGCPSANLGVTPDLLVDFDQICDMCRNFHLCTTTCLDPHSALDLFDLSVTTPSSVHAAAAYSPSSCPALTSQASRATVASPALCAAVASPDRCSDIASNFYTGAGLSLDDCLLQCSFLSGPVAFRTSTHTPSRSPGTRSPSIPAVRSPDVLTSLSCESTVARTLSATLNPQLNRPAVAVSNNDDHPAASIARQRAIDDLPMPPQSSLNTANLNAVLPATHSHTNSLSVRIPRSLESTVAPREHRGISLMSVFGPLTVDVTTATQSRCCSPLSIFGFLTGDAATPAASNDLVARNPAHSPRPHVRYPQTRCNRSLWLGPSDQLSQPLATAEAAVDLP